MDENHTNQIRSLENQINEREQVLIKENESLKAELQEMINNKEHHNDHLNENAKLQE